MSKAIVHHEGCTLEVSVLSEVHLSGDIALSLSARATGFWEALILQVNIQLFRIVSLYLEIVTAHSNLLSILGNVGQNWGNLTIFISHRDAVCKLSFPSV